MPQPSKTALNNQKGVQVETMLLTQLLELYDSALQDVDSAFHRSAKTWRLYVWGVRGLCRELGNEATNADFTESNARKFLLKYEKDHRPRSVAAVLHSLRSFGAFLVANGYLLANPCAGIQPPQLDAVPRDIPTREQLLAMLGIGCERMRDPYRGALCAAALSLLVYGGLRFSDVLKLLASDLDITDQSLYIRQGKGNKNRTVLLCDEAMPHVRRYLRLRPQPLKGSTFLLRLDGKPVGEALLRSMLRDARTIAGYRDAKALRPRNLRYGYATRTIHKSGNVKAVSVMMGHSHEGITQGLYNNPTTEILRETAEAAALNPPEPPVPLPSVSAQRNTQYRRFVWRRAP